MAEKKLTNKKLFFYGISEMPISIASLPLLTYLPNYYGSDVGISLAAIGTVWLVARIFDAFTDPLIGYLGDRTKTRWGRRRVWIPSFQRSDARYSCQRHCLLRRNPCRYCLRHCRVGIGYLRISLMQAQSRDC